MVFLTYALVREGLESGRADFKPKDYSITLSEWLQYGINRVPMIYEELKNGTILENKDAQFGRFKGIHRLVEKYRLQEPSLFDFTQKKRNIIIDSTVQTKENMGLRKNLWVNKK